MTDEFIIGRIVNTQGLKGEVRVLPSTDDPTRFERMSEITLNLRGSVLRIEIEKARQRPPFVILKLKGYDDKTSAEALRGAEITITRAEALPCQEDEYYKADLIGCLVYELLPEEDGGYLGTIANVYTTGANDVYELRGEDDDRDIILIPAITDCIKRVDIARQRVYVNLLPGLLEANRKSR